MHGLEQRWNRGIRSHVGKRFDGPVARIDVGVRKMRDQQAGDALPLEAAVRDQAQRPDRPDAGRVIGGVGLLGKTVDRGRILTYVHGGQVKLDRGGAHAQIVRVQAYSNQAAELGSERDPSTPCGRTSFDLRSSGNIVRRGALQKLFSVFLRGTSRRIRGTRWARQAQFIRSAPALVEHRLGVEKHAECHRQPDQCHDDPGRWRDELGWERRFGGRRG